MKVLYFGTYDKDYSRNRIMIDGLRMSGVEVVECHFPLWRGTSDKIEAASNSLYWLTLSLRALKAYVVLLQNYWSLHKNYDVMVLGYTGQFDILLARVLTWLARRPLVLDVFISLYLTAFERELLAKDVLRLFELVVYQLPDVLVVEADEYREWLIDSFQLQKKRFFVIPLGADNRRFMNISARQSTKLFRILYYGKYIPLHGVEYVIRAAHLLQDYPDIVFELVGDGPTRKMAESLSRELGLTQISFVNWIDPTLLAEYVSHADVLLGVFSNSEQSTRIIPNKVYEGLALKRPVITGYSATTASRLIHRQHALLVERCNPRAIADAILELYENPSLCAQLAENGRLLYEKNFTPLAIGQLLQESLKRVSC